MELKVLNFKEFNHVKFKDIEVKYNNDLNPVKFSLDEFKSIVSLLFSVQYHTLEASEEHLHNIEDILNEEYPIINITSIFGRQMIENLEDEDYLEWMINLSNKSYRLSEMIFDEELKNFIYLALIDYMVIRKFEYGKFFLNEWTKSFFDLVGYSMSANVVEIIEIFRTKEDPLKLLCDQLRKKNPDLSDYEVLLLAFTFKELFYKSEDDSSNYGIANFIIRDKINELNARIEVLKSAMLKEISPNGVTNSNNVIKRNNANNNIEERPLFTEQMMMEYFLKNNEVIQDRLKELDQLKALGKKQDWQVKTNALIKEVSNNDFRVLKWSDIYRLIRKHVKY